MRPTATAAIPAAASNAAGGEGSPAAAGPGLCPVPGRESAWPDCGVGGGPAVGGEASPCWLGVGATPAALAGCVTVAGGPDAAGAARAGTLGPAAGVV